MSSDLAERSEAAKDLNDAFGRLMAETEAARKHVRELEEERCRLVELVARQEAALNHIANLTPRTVRDDLQSRFEESERDCPVCVRAISFAADAMD